MRDAAPRISPACAGNTSGSRNRPGWKADQPRVRGEHLVALGAGAGISGSAPRARGTPKTPGCPTAKRRISPACAGNTERRYPRERCTKDQPRVRGEHHDVSNLSASYSGSAPRARGTPRQVRDLDGDGRISPACAGNTRRTCGPWHRPPDQPRVRGEHLVAVTQDAIPFGSAPRARGTRSRERYHARFIRISPACAGNTPKSGAYARSPTDQPRVRGEHSPTPPTNRAPNGSAPRARGTLDLGKRIPPDFRISPACAGNTPPTPPPPTPPSDQPRVRGEHAGSPGLGKSYAGSAPRARGTLPNSTMAIFAYRISPACAGNTAYAAAPSTADTDQPRVRGEHSSQKGLKLRRFFFVKELTSLRGARWRSP